ncbi:uncharacterized protein LOC107265201 [Cephus cinctus]|uniref:Uncharacterized protein LOC107265201 n=1 Tax=Cephus cinctus TaxID=211228 RepID=A0AAJ7VYX7_CEPCN|nr:uncharacterized protein LOC107265201 [Cephus cinctus]
MCDGLRLKNQLRARVLLDWLLYLPDSLSDGRLVEGDQILAIDGQPLDSNISHEQAISILQKARGLVELVVARSAQDVGSSLPTDELFGASGSTAAAGGAAGVGAIISAGVPGSQASSDKEHSASASVSVSSIATPPVATTPSQSSTTTAATPGPTPTPTSTPVPGGLVVERSPSAVSDASKTGSDMVLNTEWAQVEVINLINDGSGLGFGIIGGRSTGVVVKTILPGGVADRDNRLQSGDHILQIGDVNLRGMGSEQVAAVLRQSGTHVRLVVARPVEPTSPDYQALGSHAPIVPTKILGDPDELERHLVQSVPETYNARQLQGDTSYDNGYVYSQEPDIEMHTRPSLIMDVVRNPVPIGAVPIIPGVPVPAQIQNLPVLSMETLDVNSLPEMERFTVELKKDIYGLGITIAGYVCEKEELSGIFVKSISEGSAADLSNKIQINDRIVEVDGHSLQGYSNHEAVEVLRSTGQTVVLCLERYLRGPKYEQLQQAIAASELRPPQPGSPSITSLPSFPISADGETTTEIEPEGESHTTVDSAVLQEGETHDHLTEDLDEATNVEALLSDPSSELTPQIRAAIKAKWQKIVGPDTEIVVAQLKKFAEGSGLGISLEGTVDVEDGQEVRPHHYIRSILPEGPVGQNGTLRSGDELLEVNGYRLLGINHMEVVSVLKELPIHVRMVCGRNIASQDPLCPIDTAQHQAAFQTRSILGGSLQNLLPAMDRLVKAKSDGSLASTTTTATVTDASLNKMKSRSLEPLTGLAMWSSEAQIIELVKGERGLGFSILDYQDPMNPNETVIVIRSLVPGGVAQVDGQLIPGDRLLFVNDIALQNATLDQAVQALKGAPKGTVRIGVAKPLPIPDSIAQQLVTPICIVRRSRSLPDDTEAADRTTALDDVLSSRSGVSRASMNKPEADNSDSLEDFEDASPITPVHSPKKKKKEKPRTKDDFCASGKSSPNAVVPQSVIEKQEEEGEATISPNDGIVPNVDVNALKERFASLPFEREHVSSIATLASPRHAEHHPGKRVEETVEGVKMQSEVKEIVEPDHSQKEISNVKIMEEIMIYDTGPESSQKNFPHEIMANVKWQGSLVKEKEPNVEVNRETITGETGAVSVIVGKSVNLEDETNMKVNKELLGGSSSEMALTDKEIEANARKLSKERRKSLKEQKSIERVTEYLTKHAVIENSSFDDEIPKRNEARKNLKSRDRLVKQKSSEKIVSLPATDVHAVSTIKHSLFIEPRPSASSERRKSLTKQENVGSVLQGSLEIDRFTSIDVVLGEENKLDILEGSKQLESTDAHSKHTSKSSEIIKEPKIYNVIKKPSTTESCDKKRFEPISLVHTSKKEVKIQEDIQVLYEIPQEEISVLPDVQLVTAKIIDVEEITASLVEKVFESRVVVSSPPEIERLTDKTESRPKASREKTHSTEEPDQGRLQLSVLSKSISENTLTAVEEEENKISEKNIKPEILLDLSKLPKQSESDTCANINTELTKEKRSMTRIGSDGSRKVETISRIKCSASVGSDEVAESKSNEIIKDSNTLAEKEKREDIVTQVCSEVETTESTIDVAHLHVDIDDKNTDQVAELQHHGHQDEIDESIEAASSEQSTSLRRISSCQETQLRSKTLTENEKWNREKRDKLDSIVKDSPEINEKPYSEEVKDSQKKELIQKRLEYKSVDQRLRENSSRGITRSKSDRSSEATKKKQIDRSEKNPGFVSGIKQTEEQLQKAFEKQREHEIFLQNKRFLQDSLLCAKLDEDSLIGKQHSLQYQSQTLETQSEHFTASTSLENLLKLIPESRLPESCLTKKDKDSSLKNKREVETQTQQETKGTQCGSEDHLDSLFKSSVQSIHSFTDDKLLKNLRKEVQTQTQGENKSTQCDSEHIAEESPLKGSFRQESLAVSKGSFLSPRKDVEVQVEQESKGIQCSFEKIFDSRIKSTSLVPRSTSQAESPRKEVEVQTYQENKSIQCDRDKYSKKPGLSTRSSSIPLNLDSQLSQLPESQTSIESHQLSIESSESSNSSSPHKIPIILLVEGRTNMTVTHNYRDKDGNVLWAKHWGPERLVQIYREPKSSLGLSIVGGKVDLYNGGPNKSENISGIFIKNVLPNSPAGRTGELKTGDRIIEVDGIDLRNSTHERAVEAIQAAGNPVSLLVQSLVQLSPEDERQMQEDDDDIGRNIRKEVNKNQGIATPEAPTTSFRHKPPPVSPARTMTPELIQEGIEDGEKYAASRTDLRRQSTKRDSDGAGPSTKRSSMKKSLRKKAPSPPKTPGILREVSEEHDDHPPQKEPPQTPKPKYSSDESSEEEDTRHLEGNVYTKSGIEISRKSAGNVKRTKEEIQADPEPEDEFGYTAKKIKKRYDNLGHTVLMVKLEKDRSGLGISLAGHKDRNRMAVFVCGLNPKGVAHKTGGLHIGDEILEVNGTVLQGRCHLNASALIKGMPGTCFKVIVLRRSTAVNDLAVKPIVQFPPTLQDDDARCFSQYKGVHTVSIKKGQYGLGIMIIEGKHAEVGQGIFVSDIQEGSAAEQAGLQVGDMILAVNLDSLLGASYDEATVLLKKTEGVVTLTVCNPNQSKVAKEDEERAKGINADAVTSGDQTNSTAPKEPEKPKEPEPPKDPKDCEISIGKETTIEFSKSKDTGIGLTIVGGSDTPLGSIVILEVYPDGAAGKDGRLKPGDQIIEMCHESFKTIEYATAREFILKVSGTIHMIVLREDKALEEIDVEIQKKSGKGAGLCITGFKSGIGAYVSDMFPGGSALESGKIVKGDRIISICGQDMREASVEDIAFQLKVSNPVQLRLARYKPIKQ